MSMRSTADRMSGLIGLVAIVVVAALIVSGIILVVTAKNVQGQHTAVCTGAWNPNDNWGTLGPGQYFSFDYLTRSYTIVNNQLQTENFVGGDQSEDNVGSITVRSQDNLELYMDFSISYQITPDNSANVLKQFGANYVDKTVIQYGRSIPRDVAAQYPALDIIGEQRGTVENQIRQGLIEKFNGTGIDILSFNMKEIRPPQALSDAINAKEVAKQDMIRANFTAQAAIISAQGNATVVTINANASSMAKILNAQGEAQAIEQVTQMLKEQYGDASGQLYAQYLFMQALNNPNSPIQYYIIPSDGSTPVILNASGAQAAA